MNNLSE